MDPRKPQHQTLLTHTMRRLVAHKHSITQTCTRALSLPLLLSLSLSRTHHTAPHRLDFTTTILEALLTLLLVLWVEVRVQVRENGGQFACEEGIVRCHHGHYRALSAAAAGDKTSPISRMSTGRPRRVATYLRFPSVALHFLMMLCQFIS